MFYSFYLPISYEICSLNVGTGGRFACHSLSAVQSLRVEISLCETQ
jgi:hypothetical protein